MMPRSRGSLGISTSLVLSFSLIASPVFLPAWGSSSIGSGTVLVADHAYIGESAASVGATVFAGDHLATDKSGAMQLRSGASRVQLSGGAHLTWGAVQPNASAAPTATATLTGGSVAFSTAKANAFVLHVGPALFQPRSDEPTVANVTLLNPKELVVRCSRGALLITVEDDIRVIPEGSAYRVVLDREAAARAAAAPQPDPATWGQKNQQPIKAGKSKFIWYAIIFTGIATYFALDEALESPDRP
jgi:hypothetical protein